MHVEHHKWWSPNLGRDMELKVYGNYGRPMLVFPSANGRFFDYEGFGMIEACASFIDGLKLKVVCIDGIDSETWLGDAHPAEKGRRYAQYEAYVLGEAIPFIYANCRVDRIGIIATGCSMGAYHAGNLYFKHPDIFTSAILLSGVYSLDFCVGDYVDDNVYFNDPLKYLPNLEDPNTLERYRSNQIVIACGQGAWEEWHIAESRRLSEVLAAKDIPHWLDLWGEDVAHEWPWWQKMMPYFLGHLRL
jgi:esterase/lipase superfamily enzyme